MRRFILPLILALAAAVYAGATPDVLTEIPTVSMCELTASPNRYDGRVVRLRASYLFDTTATDDPFYFFYDPACSARERRVAPEFETMEKSARARAFGLIEKHARRNEAGTSGRVELLVVGRFRSSRGGYGHLGMHPFGLEVMKVESVRPIASRAPWP